MIKVANSHGINRATINNNNLREDYSEALTLYTDKLMAF